ncbi:MAG: hypothetical protein ACKVYV_16870 [Limisphaerales bacterium]
MKAFIIWTGLVSGISGVALQVPSLTAQLFPVSPPALVLRVFGLVAVFLGLMLILCSRDLKNRGVVVIWEGMLRLVGGLVIAGYGIFGDHGVLMCLAGLGDFAIGGVYLVFLPRHLGVSTLDLLLDRQRSTHSPH